MKRVLRTDIGQLGKAERLPNGFVRANARLTREGVFRYETPSGPRFEYRPASEVFKADSVASFAQVPITEGHPPKLLDADNAAPFAKGSVGENLRRDGEYLTSKLMFTNRQLIAKMDAGVKEVSCGYTCEIEEKAGMFNGQRYDCIQRNIIGNHVAIVENGRAGEGAHVRMDHKKGTQMKRKLIVVRKDELSGMATLKDEAKGYEVEMPLEWASHIQQAYAGAGKPGAKPPEQDEDDSPTNLNSQDTPDEEGDMPEPSEDEDEPMPSEDEDSYDSEENEPNGPLTAEADEDGEEEDKPPMKKNKDRKDSKAKNPLARQIERLTARLDAQETAHKRESDSFGKRVAARASLDRRASAVLGERFDSAKLSDRKVQLQVLKKLTPNEDFSKRSDDYIEARFDSEISAYQKGLKSQRSQYESLARTDSGDSDVADKSRAAMIERNQSAWKNGAAKGA